VVRNPATGGFVFLGRSDGVLNPSGVRFGSAEIYKLINGDTEGLQEVEDVLCVGQRREGENDERVLLFLKMREGSRGMLGKEVRERVRVVIREGLSRRHVPAGIFEVEDIPVSLSFLNGVGMDENEANIGMFFRIVHGERQENRNRSEANYLGRRCCPEWDSYEPRIVQAVLQVQRF
jgi:hypothetical protein